MSKILTIDLGTTYFKFTLFDRDGQLCDTRRLELPLCKSQADRVELPAEAFRQAIDQGIADLRDRQGGGLADVEAVTFATQTNSFVLLDGNARPLTPFILWPDLRAASWKGSCGVAAGSRTLRPPRAFPG